MILGVVIFSLVSTAITSIINNFDQIDEKEEEKLTILNKIHKRFKLPIELYSDLVKEIREQIENDDQDIKQYTAGLPVNLKNKLIKVFYSSIYSNIYLLQGKPQQFINWIQPLLLNQNVKQDSYIYTQNDEIDHIYFLFKGAAGLVLLLNYNIVYAQIKENDDFGYLDIQFLSINQSKTVSQLLSNKEHLYRQFTVQALTNCQILKLPIKQLLEMEIEFKEVYD